MRTYTPSTAKLSTAVTAQKISAILGHLERATIGGVDWGGRCDRSSRAVLFSVLFREVRANFVSFFVSFPTSRGASTYLFARFNLLQFCVGGAVSVCFSASGLLSPD